MESRWLMRCYYCGVAITPPDGYRGEVPGVARGQGMEVTVQARGVGPGRVEYVFVLCPLCHHMLRTNGWTPPRDDGADDGMLIPLLPTVPTRVQVVPGRGLPTPLDGLSSAPPGGPRLARGGRLQVPARRGRLQVPGARQSARGGAGSRHADHGAAVPHLRAVELVVLVLSVAAGVGMIGAAVFILSGP